MTNKSKPQYGGLLLGSTAAAKLCGMSYYTWRALMSQAHLPKPVQLPGNPRWRKEELEDWVRAGCPPQSNWEWPQAISKAKGEAA